MDGSQLTGVVAAVVAVGGTVGTFYARNKDSTDKRLEWAFKAHQELVDDLRAERADLLKRVVALETARDALEVAREESAEDRAKLRIMLREQANGMAVLRQREAELRIWSIAIMTWAAQAVAIIRGMSATIDDPPGPPPVSAADPPIH